jgi:hypothetical protein
MVAGFICATTNRLVHQKSRKKSPASFTGLFWLAKAERTFRVTGFQ